MRVTIQVAAYLAVNMGCLVAIGFAQIPAQFGAAAPVTPVASEPGPKFTLILFWKENNANTQQLAEVLKSAVAKRPERAGWTSINVNDPAHRATVDQYGVSRAPMPLALCVAQNGAITGVFVRQPNDQAVERALVTPAMADVTKALQEKKIVFVHVQSAADSPLPYGAVELMADPAFQARTTTVNILLSDATESRFLTDMKINAADINGSMLVVMAPPGVLVGKFAANVTMDQLAAQLHAAGKCCDDENCKHNQRAQ